MNRLTEKIIEIRESELGFCQSEWRITTPTRLVGNPSIRLASMFDLGNSLPYAALRHHGCDWGLEQTYREHRAIDAFDPQAT